MKFSRFAVCETTCTQIVMREYIPFTEQKGKQDAHRARQIGEFHHGLRLGTGVYGAAVGGITGGLAGAGAGAGFGAGAGAGIGAGVGAVVGSIVPGPGTALGALVGAAVGTGIGALAGGGVFGGTGTGIGAYIAAKKEKGTVQKKAARAAQPSDTYTIR